MRANACRWLLAVYADGIAVCDMETLTERCHIADPLHDSAPPVYALSDFMLAFADNSVSKISFAFRQFFCSFSSIRRL